MKSSFVQMQFIHFQELFINIKYLVKKCYQYNMFVPYVIANISLDKF